MYRKSCDRAICPSDVRINKKNFATLLLFLTLSSLFLKNTTLTNASLIDDVKNLLNKAVSSKNLSLESSVALAPGGDVNNNNQVDSGDFLRFSYSIKNRSKNSYKLTTLRTNIAENEINGISNLKGALSFEFSKKTIVIPNLNISPNQVLKISFDARTNFDKANDITISTDPELVDSDDLSIQKSQRNEVTAKKMNTEEFNKYVHNQE